MHPDHIGLAHWLCKRWNAPFYISATDFMVATVACSGVDTFSGERTVEFYAQHGLNDGETARKLLERKPYFTTLVPSVPAQYHRLMDGGRLQIGTHVWQCISGYGHAPEHMALPSSTPNDVSG
jgi:glyoxylase-like metal-dependent hydrolase (beta-lactamase superfamily II)